MPRLRRGWGRSTTCGWSWGPASASRMATTPGRGPGDPDDPDAMREAVFAYLGWLVAAFVDALADSLPRVPDEVA